MKTIYRPGQWHLIVIPGALVALPADVPGEVISDLWERLPAAKTLATAVDVLNSHAGGSFTALPPFVAAVAEGADLRIALRGRVVARVTGPDGEVDLSGAEVTTWSEKFIAGATRVDITVEEVESASVLPVQSGLVLAGAVSAEFEQDDARALEGAVGPSPVVVAASEGASAAALTAAPAPLLVAFPVPGTGTVEAPAQDALPGDGDSDGESRDVFAPDAAPENAVDVDESASIEAPSAPAGAEEPQDAATPASEPVDDSASEQASTETAGEPADGESEAAGEPADGKSDAGAAGAGDELGVSDATLLPTEVTLAPSPEEDFDQLWGATVHSAPATAAPAAVPAPPAVAGDHDGSTISAAELRARRAQAPATADETPTAVLPVAPTGASAGRIRVSTGQVITLDRTVIIGRRPRSTRASGANLPHLVAVDSPQQDISRSHLEIRPEGDAVVVIDLHTTNGSTLLRSGADPVRLHPGEQTIVLSGDVVDLGDGITVAFEDLP